MFQQSLAGDWQFRQAGAPNWLPAQVPGSVHTDLLALEQIPDPFVADYEKKVQWVAKTDWEYRYTFAVGPALFAEECIFLVCDGLDTLAEVRLNGQSLGATDNMFRQYRWQVKSLLRREENELLFVFTSPVAYITARQAERPMCGVSQAIPGAPYLRKAPCQFGWDWGPQLPPIGIWRDIRLEGYSTARLDDVHLRQRHQENEVHLEATLTIERWQDAPLTATMRVIKPDGQVVQTEQPLNPPDQPFSLSIPIARPQLWWPNGYGKQPLYRVEVTIGAAGRLYDRRVYQVGLRTLELRQETDSWGESFTFIVNGVPIFAKGSNWIPADSFPTRLTDAHMEALIGGAAATHQNMLRVWGGGFYEEERFYDLCDRYGILVWQDFIFSCSTYPLNDEAFLENVRQEVVENIRRLRHRASLALWCGNNEMEWGWVEWGWDTPALQDIKAAYEQFFHQTLPGWCAAEDPGRPYWPSSPSSNTPFVDPNGQVMGDAHYWDVWHKRKPFTAYREQYPRFMSEFGFQSLPPLETIRTYAAEADWNITSYIMEHHQRHRTGNGLIISQMTDSFRMPQGFPALVYMSMVLQAEGIRYGVEHWRRNRDRVSGTLYWQLNDCWPVASWSSLDYFGRWKALHYVARRFYAPVLLSIEDRPDQVMALHLTSDLTTSWTGTIRWSVETLDGQVLASGQAAAEVPPLSSQLVTSLDFSGRVSDDNCRQVIFIAELWQEDKRLTLSLATFTPTKHLALVDPEITVTVSQEEKQLVFDLAAQSLARFVELKLEGIDAIFSDNYFDLPAGRTVRVSCPLPDGWTVDRARPALRLYSLYNSFT